MTLLLETHKDSSLKNKLFTQSCTMVNKHTYSNILNLPWPLTKKLCCVWEIQAHLLQAQLTPNCVRSTGFKGALLKAEPRVMSGKVQDVKSFNLCIAQLLIGSWNHFENQVEQRGHENNWLIYTRIKFGKLTQQASGNIQVCWKKKYYKQNTQLWPQIMPSDNAYCRASVEKNKNHRLTQNSQGRRSQNLII